MVELMPMATGFHSVNGIVALLLKIWNNKENERLDLFDVIDLPDHIELAKSSSILLDFVEGHVLEVVFGLGLPDEKRADAWHFGLSNSFIPAVRTADTKMKKAILKAIEILSREPLTEGTVCMPLPYGKINTWCYHDEGLKLVYDVDEKNKRLTLLRLIQATTTKTEELH